MRFPNIAGTGTLLVRARIRQCLHGATQHGAAHRRQDGATHSPHGNTIMVAHGNTGHVRRLRCTGSRSWPRWPSRARSRDVHCILYLEVLHEHLYKQFPIIIWAYRCYSTGTGGCATGRISCFTMFLVL